MLVDIELFYVGLREFHLLAILIGSLFPVATVALEIVFGTKVGDLAKMRRQFRREGPREP